MAQLEFFPETKQIIQDSIPKSPYLLPEKAHNVKQLEPKYVMRTGGTGERFLQLYWEKTGGGLNGGRIDVGIRKMVVPALNPTARNFVALTNIRVELGENLQRNSHESLSAFMLLFATVNKVASALSLQGKAEKTVHLSLLKRRSIKFMRQQVKLGNYQLINLNETGIEGAEYEFYAAAFSIYPKLLGLEQLLNTEALSGIQEYCQEIT